MDRVQLKRFGDATRAFLLKRLSREVLVFLFFVIVSAVFWFMQTLEGTYDMKVELPLRLTDVPTGVVITTEPPQTVQVTLHDKGFTLLRYYMSMPKHELAISYETYDKHQAYGRVIVPHADLRKQVTKWVESTTTIASVHPDTIEYYFSRGVKRKLPICYHGVLSADSHHFIARYSFKPDSTIVWGPKDILDTMTAVYTEPAKLTELTQSTDSRLKLTTAWGTKADVTEVVMHTVVDAYVEKTVNVRVSGINFPANKQLRTFPAEVAVHFHIGSLEYHTINAENFVVGITYEELLFEAHDANHFTPVLRYAPVAAKHIRLEPETVDYLIEEVQD